MANDKDRKISLSRRKALAGIGTIGAAAGLGGLGTLAQFTDSEETSIQFTAGGIDGTMVAHHRYNGELEGGIVPESEDEGAGLQVVLDDVKPGDYGSFCFELTVENNPAWIASCVGIEEDIDHRAFEPELEAENETDHTTPAVVNQNYPSPGELAESILMIPFYRDGCPSAFWDPEGLDNDGEPTYGEPQDIQYGAQLDIGNVASLEEFWNSREGTNDFDELQPKTLREIATSPGSLHTMSWVDDQDTETAALEEAPEGTQIDDGCVFLNGELAEGGDTNVDAQENSSLQPGSPMYFGYDWHIPFGVRNEVQGDRVIFNLGFVFSQIRSTEAPQLANIYAPGENLPGGD